MKVADNAIDNMQDRVRDVRALFHITVTSFADMMGVTRQTIYNIENYKTKLTKTQYLAICALISKLLEEYPERKREMDALWERGYDRPLKKDIINVKFLK